MGGNASDIVTAFGSGRATAAVHGVAEPVPRTARRRGGGRAGDRGRPERAHGVFETLEPPAAPAGAAHLPGGDRPVGTARHPAVDTDRRLHPLGGLRHAPRRWARAPRSLVVPPRRTATPRARRPGGAHRRCGECAGHVRRPADPVRTSRRSKRPRCSIRSRRRSHCGRSTRRNAARGDPHRRLDAADAHVAGAVANGGARRVRRTPVEPTLTIRPIGRTLGPATGPTVAPTSAS